MTAPFHLDHGTDSLRRQLVDQAATIEQLRATNSRLLAQLERALVELAIERTECDEQSHIIATLSGANQK